MKEGDTITTEEGGRHSFTKARFDAIPAVCLRLLAQCLGFGLRKYGKNNWQSIPIDENIGHAQNHLNEWIRGDRSEPHLVNAMARVSFALWQAVESGDQEDEYFHPDELKHDDDDTWETVASDKAIQLPPMPDIFPTVPKKKVAPLWRKGGGKPLLPPDSRKPILESSPLSIVRTDY
jgi:hypothetical protein